MAENENMEKAALHKAIFMALPHLQKIKFAVLEVKNCNATESKLFSDVDCKFDMIKTEREEEELKNEVRPLTVNFTTLFRPGLELLTACQDENIVMEALVLLNDYFQNIGFHEESLIKVFCDKGSEKEDITVAYAEHFLGKLAPGKSYIIDDEAEKKGLKCKCGYNVDPNLGSTGIGHEEVWHGPVDIICSSDNFEDQCIATCERDLVVADSITSSCTPSKRIKEDGGEEDCTGGKTMTEVKVKAVGTSERALAQTIVFSLLQRQRHPNFRTSLTPNILFSPDFIQIIMYDAVNDVLLCSNFIDLFNVNADGHLSSEAVVTLWLVLHYRIFCCGLHFKDNVEAEIFKSNFHSLTKEKWNVYTKHLKSCVPCFPVIDKEIKVDTWNRKVLQGTEYCKGMRKKKTQ
ncbi:uncharacterized protein LOC128161572 [Crassostrea angulata]|uniref:uncharacterized protein LOC128161572 n=1 Tax=Magallana angulata TaxID=2784310 RepID=UPI0022B14F9A|nr:uncharacterized protein LOC128161572 [Crassostrea angulata]XP_052680845.1 uncharacterized protein LOC128161572 [Crassostrea angulata]